MSVFYDCDNQCGASVPKEKVIWVANTYTVCSDNCKAKFLEDHPDIAKTNLSLLGVNLPQTPEQLARLAISLL